MTEYRSAGPADAMAIAAVHATSWRENYRGAFLDAFLDGDLHEERLRVWQQRLDHPPNNQFVHLAVDGTNMAGFICAYAAHDPRWGSLIDNLHVARAFQGNGIGRMLMRQAAAWLDARYPDLPIYLLVLEPNASARRFYERLGGRMSDVTVDTLGGAQLRSCRYTWRRPATLSAA